MITALAFESPPSLLDLFKRKIKSQDENLYRKHVYSKNLKPVQKPNLSTTYSEKFTLNSARKRTSNLSVRF